MKQLILLTVFAIFLLLSINSYAKIHRVGYFGTPVPGTDYANLQAANDSAAVGDTILVFPGSWSATFKKKLVLIGYGYFVAGTGKNANLQNITGSQTIQVYLDSTASNSVFLGLDGISILAYYQNPVSNITISRCNGSIYFNDKLCNNWQIRECNLASLGYYWGGGIVSNLSVNNCYLNSFSMGSGAASGLNGQFNNDIFNSGADFFNGTFLLKNNIFLYYHLNELNCVFQNCIGTSDAYPVPTGNSDQNITTAAMQNNVFVGYSTQTTYSNDGRWVLKAGSPAIHGGFGGTDCGIFGGVNPYKLSGIPPVPSFYLLTAPSSITSTNPYTITFSVRSNN
ncbi:MAG TPA: hypothetical protein VF939_13620 [Puia sp.]